MLTNRESRRQHGPCGQDAGIEERVPGKVPGAPRPQIMGRPDSAGSPAAEEQAQERKAGQRRDTAAAKLISACISIFVTYSKICLP